MKVAFCFPGQGSQEVGMGRAMAQAVPGARAVYDRASAVLGYDLAEVCFEGPIERLTATDVTQPAIFATSVACLNAVLEAGLRPDYVVGHSVGEYAALVAAEAVDEEAAMLLVRERGLATAAAAAASPGAMAAIIGLEDAAVEELCAGIEGVWPANYNCPGQLVVSGTEDGVTALMAAAEACRRPPRSALRVSGGFHSPLTALAADRLQPALAQSDVPRAGRAVLLVDDRPIEPAAQIASILVRQLTSPVLFTQSVGALRASASTHVRRDRPRERARRPRASGSTAACTPSRSARRRGSRRCCSMPERRRWTAASRSSRARRVASGVRSRSSSRRAVRRWRQLPHGSRGRGRGRRGDRGRRDRGPAADIAQPGPLASWSARARRPSATSTSSSATRASRATTSSRA